MTTVFITVLFVLWVLGVIFNTYTYNELKHTKRYLQLVEQSNRELSTLVLEVRYDVKHLKPKVKQTKRTTKRAVGRPRKAK